VEDRQDILRVAMNFDLGLDVVAAMPVGRNLWMEILDLRLAPAVDPATLPVPPLHNVPDNAGNFACRRPPTVAPLLPASVNLRFTLRMLL
jgi:hypothetical protein